MASSINRIVLLVATALTGVGCQSGAATKAMNPTASSGVAMLRAQAQAVSHQEMRSVGLAVAESRVAAAPDDLEARRTLAQVYFSSGRFRSAVQAFDDALAIAPTDDRLRLRKALALLAQGKQGEAVTELERIVDLPDAGLAYALAGNPDRGVEMLGDAARRPDATARTRQNLALAHALGGQWARARIIAAQDLDPATVEVRIRQWAELAARGDVAAQTAGLLGISPMTADAGRPIGLAFIPIESRVQRTAVAAAPTAVAAAPRAEVASALPRVDMAASMSAITVAPIAPVAKSLLPKAAPVGRSVAPAPRAAVVRPASAAVPAGRWVVQLAAYDRPDLLEANWKHLAVRNADLVGDYPAVRSQVTIGSRRYYRLALAGFDARAQADNLCGSLRAKGSACFVRDAGPPAPRAVALRRGPRQA